MIMFEQIKQNVLGFFTEGKPRVLSGWKQSLFVAIGCALSIYQVWALLFAKLDPIHQMATHLTFILMLTFFHVSYSKHIAGTKVHAGIDAFLIGLSAVAGLYFVIHSDRIATRAVGVDALTELDIIFGVILVALVIEAARRTIGFSIIIIAFIGTAYALFGHVLDGVWHHYEMTPIDVLDQLVFSFNGIWGSPIAVASSFVFIFVLFGAFFQNSGAGEFFFRLSVAIAGRSRGGATKIAIIASSLFATISGSPTANVVTTGPFTIPMAKRLGYSSRFAAAIEACASMGGSLLPPIMGSSAFLMVAVTGIPYKSVAIAALLPGILFYISLLSIVHFKALRTGLPRTEAKKGPQLGGVLKEGWYHLIPIVVLVTLLYKGYSLSRTGVYGILTVIVLSWFTKKHKMGLKKIIQALSKGAKSAIPISTACAVAGIVIASIMSTGLGGKLNSIILNITSGHLFPTLILIMIMCIILGMGMPVAAAYVLTAMLAGPVLIELGISPLAAHLFIVYFSIVSAITPPVAVAAFAAAGIAKTNPTRVGIEAVMLGSASYIIPFIFIYNPLLLMKGTLIEITYGFLSTSIGLVLLGSGLMGYYYRKTGAIMRIFLILSGISLMYPNVFMNLIGVVLALSLLIMQKVQHMEESTAESMESNG